MLDVYLVCTVGNNGKVIGKSFFQVWKNFVESGIWNLQEEILETEIFQGRILRNLESGITSK